MNGGVVVQKTIFLALYTLLLGGVYVWAGTPQHPAQIPSDDSGFAFVPSGVTLLPGHGRDVVGPARNVEVINSSERKVVVAEARQRVQQKKSVAEKKVSDRRLLEKVSAWEPVVRPEPRARQKAPPVRSAARAAVLRFTTEERLFFLRPEHRFQDMSYLGRPPSSEEDVATPVQKTAKAEPKKETKKAKAKSARPPTKLVSERRLVIPDPIKDVPKVVPKRDVKPQRVAVVKLPPQEVEIEEPLIAAPSPKPRGIQDRMTSARIAKIQSERRTRARIAALIRERAEQKRQAKVRRARREAARRYAALNTAKADATVAAPQPVHQAKRRPTVKAKKRARSVPKRRAKKVDRKIRRKVTRKRTYRKKRRVARLSRRSSRRRSVSPGALHRRMIMGSF